MINNILSSASKQILSEVLGFDQARIYYLLLTNKGKEIDKEYSYSKKYRLMKELFLGGYLGKIKHYKKDFFVYVILPPAFLREKKIELEITNYLEKLYIKNFLHIWNTKFSQLILKNEKGLIAFFLKHIMKEKADINCEYNVLDLGRTYKIDVDKVSIRNSEKNRIFGIIDESFEFEFSKVKDYDGENYIGHYEHKDIA